VQTAVQAGAGARPPRSSGGGGLRAAIDWLDANVEYWLNVLLYAYILVIVFVEVLGRYVLKTSIVWSEETAVYAFIWMSYLAMARLARSRSHLAFTPLRDMMSRGWQLACLLVSDLALGVLAVIVVPGLISVRPAFVYHSGVNGSFLTPGWYFSV